MSFTYTSPATGTDGILRSDGAFVPDDPLNSDWQAYEAWREAGNTPTAAPPPSPADLIATAEAKWQAVLAAGETFNVAASGEAAVPILCDGTNATRADLALLALYGQQYPTGTKTWLDNTGKTTLLVGTQLVTLATLAGNWVSDTYPALVTLIGEISASPPTVTTTAQIDAYVWPTA